MTNRETAIAQLGRWLQKDHGFSPGEAHQLKQQLSASGLIPSGSAQPDEDFRSEVVGDRATRRLRKACLRIRDEAEKRYETTVDRKLLAGLPNAVEAVERRLERLVVRLLAEPRKVRPFEVAAILDRTIGNPTRPVLAWPEEEDAGRILLFGDLLALLDSLRLIVARHFVPAESSVSLSEGSEGAAEQLRLHLRELLVVAGEEPSSEEVKAAGDLLNPENKWLRQFAAAQYVQQGVIGVLRAHMCYPYPVPFTALDCSYEQNGSNPLEFSRRVSLQEPAARLAVDGLAAVAIDDGESLKAPAVVAYPVRLDPSEESPAGFRVAVNDPWVAEGMIRNAIQKVQAQLQQETTERNLSEEEQRLEDLVNAVEADWKATGQWGEDRTRRPRGFWPEVTSQWNELHPDDQRTVNNVRVMWHRLRTE